MRIPRIPIDWGVVVPILAVAAIIWVAWENSDPHCVLQKHVGAKATLVDVNYTGKPCR